MVDDPDDWRDGIEVGTDCADPAQDAATLAERARCIAVIDRMLDAPDPTNGDSGYDTTTLRDARARISDPGYDTPVRHEDACDVTGIGGCVPHCNMNRAKEA